MPFVRAALPSLAIDLDTADDLRALLASDAPAPRTRRLLATVLTLFYNQTETARINGIIARVTLAPGAPVDSSTVISCLPSRVASIWMQALVAR